jgi:hypothetical protein
MKGTRSGRTQAVAELVALTYELLDAHSDTAELACSRHDDLRWRAHLDYLRALQRKGRQLLARISSSETCER